MFGEWQPEATAPTNAAVLIYVQDWEHYGYGVCRAIKVDMGTGIRWHACAWGIGRDVPMDRVRWWMPLPEPPRDKRISLQEARQIALQATTKVETSLRGDREMERNATEDEQNMPAVLVRAAVSEFRRTGHWPCDVFERMVRWVDENTPPRWREGEEGEDGR